MSRILLVALFTAALLSAACEDSPFANATETVGAQVIPGDTTLVVGQVTLFAGIAFYRVCPSCRGVPNTISWSIADSAVIDGLRNSDGSISVEAVAPGSTFVIAVVNGDFRDSSLVTVVAP